MKRLRHLPFYRTIEENRQIGLNRLASKLFAILICESIKRLKYKPTVKVAKVNNSKMMLYPRTRDINSDLYLYRKREPICTKYLIKSGIIRKNDTVLDIGANIGYYALIESGLVGDGGTVYAIEPVTPNYKLLKSNVMLNGFRNVSTYQYALGDQDCHAEIFVSSRSNQCAMNKEAVGGEVLGVQNVHMLTVDQFLVGKKQPSLVRMDVEGYEYEIIKGMKQTLKGKTSILLELHPEPAYLKPEKLEELLDILEANHYRVRFIVYEHKVRENPITRTLLRHAGDKLPIVGENLSIKQLRQLIPTYSYVAAPNILFEKTV
jgi:FkbM family methyltransferase